MRNLSPIMKALIALGAVASLCLAALISVPLLMVMGNTVVSAESSDTFQASSCSPVALVGDTRVPLDEKQLANARTIIETGRELNVPNRGLVVAIATAMQESTLRNLPGGDRDSVGLFQQRDAWASRAERLDPATSARMFYTGGRAGQPGLDDIDGWASMPITRAAQAVQVSAFPLAYAKWETMAAALVESAIGTDPLACTEDVTSVGLPGGAVGTMLNTAQQQVGDPYIWGAVGPDSFDCSGLVVYSWRQAGYQLKIRTAAQMWNASTPVPRGQEKPGDLLFGAFDTRVAGAGHVMIVLRPGLAINAPARGRNVERTDYSKFGSSWRVGRLKPSAMVKLNRPA